MIMEQTQNVNYVISNAKLVMRIAATVSYAKEIGPETHVCVLIAPMMIFLQLSVKHAILSALHVRQLLQIAKHVQVTDNWTLIASAKLDILMMEIMNYVKNVVINVRLAFK